ncbi:aldose 1-epimerase [Caulobacter sp. KR2-114]|uniref:aldose 1-epimerase n=1 Tax=Caulobacter sp. KR2-114 TaxID=3400912 RepID=UPI003BFEB4F2
MAEAEARAAPLILRHGDWVAGLAPEVGGAILSLRRAGRDILRPTPTIDAGDVRRSAGFAMVPFANRIDGGRLVWAGREWRLPRDPADPRHALHGVGWRRPWRVEWAVTSRASLVFDHAPCEDWPFAFRARQQLALSDQGLSVTLSMTNTGADPAPAGLGLHPYVVAPPDAVLTLACAGRWSNSPDGLPAAREPDVAGRFLRGLPLADARLDHDIYGWGGSARVTAPDGSATIVTGDAVFGHLRLYTPPDGGACAIEPVTHMANAAHRMHEPDHGLAVLAPGETLQGTVRIVVAGA